MYIFFLYFIILCLSFFVFSVCYFFFSSRRRHTRCALVTGVQTCALPICTSHLISLRLARANSLREIGQAAQGMTELVRTLHAQGAKMSYLMELISALNRRVMAKIFEFVVPSAMRQRICLLVLGSEGRREQILKTDQDNALVLAEIGRASCRERVCEYGLISWVAVSL